MKTTIQLSRDWFNSLSKPRREELSLEHYGSTLLWDEEIEQIWMKEVPQPKLYSKEDIFALIATYNETDINSPSILKFIEEHF